MNNLIVGSENIKGDITSCKIENKLVSIERDKPLSFKEKQTYVSYDVCTKTIIKEYSIPVLTPNGIKFINYGYDFLQIIFILGIMTLITVLLAKGIIYLSKQ